MSEKLININEADENILVELPGIALALATRIVEYRENIHPFEDIEDLAAVPGISERMVRNFANLITVRAGGANGSGESASTEIAFVVDGPGELVVDPLAAPGEDVWDDPERQQDEIVALDQLQQALTSDDAADIAAIEVADDDILRGDEILLPDEILLADEDEIEDEIEDEEPVLGHDVPVELALDPSTVDTLDEQIDSDLSHSIDVDAVMAEESDDPQDVDYDVVSQFEAAATADEAVIDHQDDDSLIDSVLDDETSADSYLAADLDPEVDDIEDFEPESHFEAAEAAVESTTARAEEGLFSSSTTTTAQPDPAPVAAARRVDWRTVLISSLLGAGLTLLLLALLNGSLTFVTQNNATALQQTVNQQTATITDQIDTMTAQSEQVRSQAALIETLQSQLAVLSKDLNNVEATTTDELSAVTSDITSLDEAVSTLGSALATTNSDISTLQEIDAALQEVDNLLNERVDNVAGAAEEVDAFLFDLRDLLIGLKGVPEPAPADPGSDSSSGEDAAPGVQPTRTPRPTPTPLAVPTSSP